MKQLFLLLIFFCSCGEVDKAKEAQYVSFKVLKADYYRAEKIYLSRGHYIDVDAYWKIKVVYHDTIYYLNFSKNPHLKKDSIYTSLLIK